MSTNFVCWALKTWKHCEPVVFLLDMLSV